MDVSVSHAQNTHWQGLRAQSECPPTPPRSSLFINVHCHLLTKQHAQAQWTKEIFTHSLSLRHSRLPFVPQARVYSSWRIPSEFHLRPPARSVPCARRGLWITSLLLWVFQKREDSRVQKITVTSTSELIVSDEKIKKSCVSCWYFLCWKGGLIAVTSITHWEHKVKQQIRKWRIHIPPRLKGVQEASIQWLKCKTAVQNMQGS